MFDKLSKLFQAPARRPYRLFQVEPSLACNLDCVMCPWREMRPDMAVMSWDVFSRIAENFHQTKGVDFTGGGEPTLNPRLMDMIRVAKQAGCEVGFSTNGTLVDAAMAEGLLSLQMDWISFSVDGATAETYESIRQGSDFDRVIGNIAGLQRLKAARGSTSPTMMMVLVMMPENYQQLPAYIELAHSLGVDHVIAKNLDVILKQEDDSRRLFYHAETDQVVDLEPIFAEAQKQARRLGVNLRLYSLQPQELAVCDHNPLHSLFFNWAGYVSPCITLSYAEHRIFDGRPHIVPCQRFGQIQAETLEQIWQKIEYQEFRRPFQVRVRLERQAAIDLLVGDGKTAPDLPAAPEGCRTCYYLYGV